MHVEEDSRGAVGAEQAASTPRLDPRGAYARLMHLRDQHESREDFRIDNGSLLAGCVVGIIVFLFISLAFTIMTTKVEQHESSHGDEYPDMTYAELAAEIA